MKKKVGLCIKTSLERSRKTVKNKIDITFHRNEFFRVKTRRLHYPQSNWSAYN